MNEKFMGPYQPDNIDEKPLEGIGYSKTLSDWRKPVLFRLNLRDTSGGFLVTNEDGFANIS